MSDIFSLLNIDKGRLLDFPLLAKHVVDRQVEKGLHQCMAQLKEIGDRMLVEKGLEVPRQSIDEVISKVIHFAEKGDTSGDNWTIRELRIVSYYLMKLRDKASNYLFALDLLDQNWRNMFFNGLAYYLMDSWHGLEPEYRDKTSQLLIRKLNEYEDNNRRYTLWKDHANWFEANGPMRMHALLSTKRMDIMEAPSLLGFKNSAIRQSYYSDVIIKYVTSNGIVDRDILRRIFEVHKLDRTKKLIFAYLVEREDQTGDDFRRGQLCSFANSQLGDITVATTWAPFIGATETEAQRLRKAMKLVNFWFAQQFIESFFEICVQDPDRKSFWMEYVKDLSGFKIVGSKATYRLLQTNSVLGSMLTRYFMETNSSMATTSALVFFIKNKMIVEFSDSGAVYAYNQHHPMVSRITHAYSRISSTNDLKMPEMGNLVEKDYWGDYCVFNEEGKLHHKGNWQNRLIGWLNYRVLSSSNTGVSFIDQRQDDIFKVKPLPAENFVPKPYEEKDTLEEESASPSSTEPSTTDSAQTDCPTSNYRTVSKSLERDVRVEVNAKGLFLFLGKGHYGLIKPLKAGERFKGSVWIKESTMAGWYELLHNYEASLTRSIGFIRINANEVIFKEELYVAGKTKFKLY